MWLSPRLSGSTRGIETPDRHGHCWHKRATQRRGYASPEPGEIWSTRLPISSKAKRADVRRDGNESSHGTSREADDLGCRRLHRSSLLGPIALLPGLKSLPDWRSHLPEPGSPSWTDGASPSSGRRANTSHPSPVGPAAAVPPSSSARSKIERSPTPGVHEPGGRPSSRIVTASVPFAVILTRQRRPSECVNGLLMASLAMR